MIGVSHWSALLDAPAVRVVSITVRGPAFHRGDVAHRVHIATDAGERSDIVAFTCDDGTAFTCDADSTLPPWLGDDLADAIVMAIDGECAAWTVTRGSDGAVEWEPAGERYRAERAS